MERKKIHSAWIIMIGCCIITFVGMGLVLNTVGLYFPSIIEEFGVSGAQTAVYMTVFALGMIVAMPIAGSLLGKVNLKVLLTACTALVCGGFLLNSFAGSLIPLYVGALMIGLGAALLPGMLNGIIISNWFYKKMGLALGIVASTAGLGGALFNPVVSAVIVNMGWRNGYRVSALLVVAVILPTIWLTMRFAPGKGETVYGAEAKEEQASGGIAPQQQDGMTFKQAVRGPLFYTLLVSAAAMAFQSGLVQLISTHVTGIGFTLTVAASVMSGVMIGNVVGKLSLGVLLDAIRPSLALLICMVVGASGWAGLVFARSQALMIVCGFLLGTAQAFMVVGFPYVSRKVFGGREFSRINSIHMMISGLVPAFSIVGVSAIFDRTGSFNIPFFLSSAMVVISVFFMVGSLVAGAKEKAVRQ
jgi:MFS family permease